MAAVMLRADLARKRGEGDRMTALPYVAVSCAISIDGYLDDAGPSRLTMSNAADLDRVDGLRAESDAILVGASTIRRDNARLLVKSGERRAGRVAAGRTPSPTKVTVTSSGELARDAAFFTTGEVDKLVYCPRARAAELARHLGERATVVGLDGGLDDGVDMRALLRDLAERRGVRSLLVEGGGAVITQFLAGGLVDELQLAIAPFFVGEETAPRLVGAARFPWTAARPAALAETRRIGDVVLLRYALSARAGLPEPQGSEPQGAER